MNENNYSWPLGVATYADSADGVMIDYDRAYREIDKHYLADWTSLQDFNRECWNVFASGGTIDAAHVMNWLGY
tara:strand:- start:3789 stop:4007 length:219 start_codon:yes stop_codon:yes gene_type:complete